MNKRRNRCLLPILLVLCLCLQTIRAEAADSMSLDITTHVVYQGMMADTLISAYSRLAKNAEKQYDGHNYMLLGKVTQIGDGGKTFELAAMSSTVSGSIPCRVTSVLNELNGVHVGDTVKVYGKVKISTWISNSIEVSAKAVRADQSVSISETAYGMIDGAQIDSKAMTSRTIGDGRFTYLIPSSWSNVEYELPDVDGYQYKLNKLSGDGAREYLFVFYVDRELLADKGDISKTTDVQKAIIANIIKQKKIRHKYTPLLPRDINMFTQKADYGSFASYYGIYRDQNNNIEYRFEFMFPQEQDGEGMRCLLYVYGKDTHADEVLLMMRALQE